LTDFVGDDGMFKYEQRIHEVTLRRIQFPTPTRRGADGVVGSVLIVDTTQLSVERAIATRTSVRAACQNRNDADIMDP
jgi:hypothetical protein